MWWYDKSITFIKQVSNLNDSGFFGKSETENITVPCDVQPLNLSRDAVEYDDAGKVIEADLRVFCDPDSFINTNCKAVYNGVTYEIVKISDWDDYYIIFIKGVI